MSVYVKDLAPFHADGCWMVVLLAREANVGVVIRRGPGKWWNVTLWDTRRDQFTRGQWFHGWMYPEKCDLSPDGKLLLYFAGKFRSREVEKGYERTWTAVSRPPYLTALALWPMGTTWGGRGVFLDNRTVLLATEGLSFGGKHHPDHPPGPLSVVELYPLRKNDPRIEAVPCWRTGWTRTLGIWKKPCGDLTLETERRFRGGHDRSLFALSRNDGKPLATFDAHWADWDQRGRLVATAGGRVLAGKLAKGGRLSWRQLIALNEDKPSRMEAPAWAQRW